MFALPRRNGHALIKFVAVCGVVISAIQLLTLTSAFAQDSRRTDLSGAPMIFDMRKNLPLEPDEPVYHDFYINAGNEAGFKKGMYFIVMRQVPVHDPVQNKQQGTLSVKVARLHVIHVEHQLTVARLQAEFTDEDRPALDFESVMVGDRVDVSSLTTEAPEAPKKKKAASGESGETEPAKAPAAENASGTPDGPKPTTARGLSPVLTTSVPRAYVPAVASRYP